MADDVKLWRYYLPSEKGEDWAEIVLGSDGFFAAVSDWGNYAFAWRSFGDNFREFVAGLARDPGYLMSKLSRENVYQADETLARVKKAICEMRRRKEIERDDAREFLYEIAEKYESLATSVSFALWYQTSDGAREVGDAWECAKYDYPLDVRAFCEKVMPRLAAILRAELAAERQAANA